MEKNNCDHSVVAEDEYLKDEVRSVSPRRGVKRQADSAQKGDQSKFPIPQLHTGLIFDFKQLFVRGLLIAALKAKPLIRLTLRGYLTTGCIRGVNIVVLQAAETVRVSRTLSSNKKI